VPFWVVEKKGIKALKQVLYVTHNKDLKESLHHQIGAMCHVVNAF
jgi:hypothetical protein